MSEIKIKQAINLEYIDKLYSQLYSTNKEKINILLPKTIKEENFGVLPLLLQFISTWERITQSGDLVLPIESVKDDVTEYLQQYFAYVSFQVAQKYRDVVDVNGKSIVPLAEEAIKRMSVLMNKNEGPKHNSIMLTCFDHIDESLGGVVKAFYSDDKFILNEDAHKYFEQLYKFIDIYKSNLINDAVKNNLQNFKGIIYELIKNTEDWAKTNIHGDILYPNVRGLYLKLHKNLKNKFIENAENFIGLKKYLSHKEFVLAENQEQYFLEISVFDSGPGHIRRYLKLDEPNFSLPQQIDILQKCLVKHNTSDISHESDFRGLGLDRVLETLNKRGGFLMIRAENLSVYRDLIKNKYIHTQNSSDIILHDIKTDLIDNYSMKWRACGSVISIIYPLNEVRKP